jgi:hypothetical protein
MRASLYNFMTAPDLAGPLFAASSWDGWKAVARLVDGEASQLAPQWQDFVRQLIGRDTLPDWSPDEFYACFRRRSGKSTFVGAACASACTIDQRKFLTAGEWCEITAYAPTMTQAQVLWDRSRGIVASVPALERNITREGASTLEFAWRTRLTVGASSFRSSRGPTRSLVAIDELSYMMSEDNTLSDVELIRALRPSLLTLGGQLLAVSSPFTRSGHMFEMVERFHGEIETA